MQEASALTAWLATDPTASGDPDFLIIGDLNAYAKEDPVTALKGAGYVNLTETFEGEGGYSYSFNGEFGHIDHALATPHLAEQVAAAVTWHANADELVYYDYNLENKSAAQQTINAGTVFRYADHDPVVISVNLHPEYAAPVFTAQPQSQTVTAGDTVTFFATATGFPAPTFQWQHNGADIDGATSPVLTIDPVKTAAAGSYTVSAHNSIGSATSDPATLTVNKAVAGVALGGLTQPFDGAPKPVTVTTNPAGLAVAVTYDGSAMPPTAVGTYAVVATVNDPDYSGSTAGTLTIADTVAPVITSLTAWPKVLWPPNHQMVPVRLNAVVADAADPAPVTRIVAVTSSDPTAGTGHGPFVKDWQVTGPLTLQLRAEQGRNGSTRVYTITVESRDHSGNASTRTVTVTVPRQSPHFPDRHHGPKRPGGHFDPW